jgi:hypothetical protein
LAEDTMKSIMHRTAYLSLLALAVSLASANVRGAEETGNTPVIEEAAPRTSNMDSWQDEESRKGSWTWFGMGYESRRSAASVAAPGGGGGGSAGGGKGGPGGRKP